MAFAIRSRIALPTMFLLSATILALGSIACVMQARTLES